MNVLLIPEDFRNDQYMLAPLFSGLLNICGKPNANVRVCLDPLLGGVSEAMKTERLDEIVARYDGMVDIYVLCVDRDGRRGREEALAVLEGKYSVNRHFFCVAAIEELEAWLLAAHDLPSEWRWQDIRSDVSVKEDFYEPFAKLRKVEYSPGQGRKILGQAMKGKASRVVQRCSEELAPLLAKLQAAV